MCVKKTTSQQLKSLEGMISFHFSCDIFRENRKTRLVIYKQKMLSGIHVTDFKQNLSLTYCCCVICNIVLFKVCSSGFFILPIFFFFHWLLNFFILLIKRHKCNFMDQHDFFQRNFQHHLSVPSCACHCFHRYNYTRCNKIIHISLLSDSI